MTEKKKQARRKVGVVVRIDLGSGLSAYARILSEPLMAFYDFRSGEEPGLEEVVSKPILFKVWVMNSVVSSGRWPVIGAVPLDNTLREPVDFFKRDSISKEYCLYREGQELPATQEQCAGLEYAAVWSATHIEGRLRAYFAGLPNKWVTSMGAP
jgi:hypothetical protein